MATSRNLREEVPINIVKGANLEKAMNDLFNNFESGEQENAKLVNDFFDQPYFKGEESLINKFIEIKPDIKFDDIKDEGINLALLLYDNWTWEFHNCLNKITNDELKKAFIQKIFDKVQAEIGGGAPYTDFATQCTISGDTNVLIYFQKVVDYLNEKENVPHGKKTINILKRINITNNELNLSLPTGDQIPGGIELANPTIPTDTKNAFDILLSFEIGKEADRTSNIAKDFFEKIEGLFTNTFPAVNTIISENDEYKYDESKLGAEYQGKLQDINNDTNLNDTEKEKQIDNLRWEYYLKYLKTKNNKIGNALEQLYNNDFDYSKLDNSVLKDYIEKVVDIRLKMLFNSGLKDVIKVDFGNLDEFKNFCKDLTDPAKTNISLSDVNSLTGGTTGTINIPVKKSIIEGPNPRLKKDISQFGNKDKFYDALPIRYEINKSDINNLDITIEDKTKLLNYLSRFNQGNKYIIEGKDIGMLIYLFFVINSRFPITEFNSDEQKRIQDLFGETKDNDKRGEDKQDKEKGEEDENKNEDEEKGEEDENKNEDEEKGEEGYTSEKFKEDIEKFGPGKFENGSEIWIPAGKSELPGGGYQWMKIKISNINNKNGTFKGTVFGGELKFTGKYEGKSREFKMDKETIEEFKNTSKKVSNNENNVWLQPNPDKSDFNNFRNKLNNRLGTTDLGFPANGTTWNGNKFIQKITDEKGKEKEVEVKYFGANNDDKSTYKIEYNPSKKSFTVSSTFNGEEKGKDGKSEKKRFSYKRDMDWNNFLIFFTQKGLVPQTEDEAKSAISRQDKDFKMQNSGRWKLNWFSISNIKNVFKTLKGNIKKKIDDYNKEQDKKLEDILVGDWGLYGKLANILGFIPSMKSGFGELEQEYYNERDNRTWKKIEGYLKIFQSDPDFGTTFDKVPPFAHILGGKSYKDFILGLFYAKRGLGDDDIWKAAALLLANIEKGGSPYRGLSTDENKGLWVKVLLGDAHYEQFKRDKAACIRARDLAESSKNSGLQTKGLNEELATCEMDYIINNIRGSYGSIPYSFGSKELRGLNGDKTTEYVDNPSKRLLSDQFANKLESAKSWFNKGSVEESYGKLKSNNNFEKIEDEFGKMGSSRYQKGAGALRKLFDLADDQSLKKRAQKCFLAYLLSGALDINCDPGLKKQAYGWAKPMSFVPGMLVKKKDVAENIAILLDDATDGDFSKNVTKYFHKGDLLANKGPDFKGLKKELDAWLTDEMMDKLNDYFSKLPTKDFSGYTEPQKTILEKFKSSLIEEDVEEFDRGLLDNPTIVNNGLLTNINVVSDRLRIEDGEFKGKDSDDISNKKAFWKDIKDSVSKLNSKDSKTVDFVLNKYFTRFGLNSSQERQNVYKWINTAYYYKEQVNSHGGTYSPGHKKKIKDNHGRIIDAKIPVGKIENKDINKILLYGLEGNIWSRPPLSGKILPKELKDALDAFQTFFESAFKEGILNYKDVKNGAFKLNIGDSRENDKFLLGGWDVYQKIARKDDYTSVLDSEDAEYNGNFSELKESEQKKIWRSILRDDDLYINPHMETIEKALKRNRNILDGNRRLTTSNDNERLTELQESL